MPYQQSSLVDEYIARFGAETQRRLKLLRKAVQATFPKSTEGMSYGMPTYTLGGGRNIVHFNANRGKVGIYGITIASHDSALHARMQPYHTSRATLQFSNEDPFPMMTIRQILAYQATKIASLASSAFTKMK